MKYIIILVTLSAGSIICPSEETQYGESCVPTSCREKLQRIDPQIQNLGFYNDTRGSIQNMNDHIIVSFQFKDVAYDGTFMRDNEQSCIKSELMRTSSSYYPLGFNESPVTSSFNFSTGFRTWSFVLVQGQYEQFLVPSTVNSITHYMGFYAYRFNISTEIIYTYYFAFSFAINKERQPWGASQYIQQDLQNLATSCDLFNKIQQDMVVKFAEGFSTKTCADAKYNTTLYLGGVIYLCVQIADPAFKSCQLRAPQVYLSGSQLYTTIPITSYIILSPGVYIYELVLPFIYSDIFIVFKAVSFNRFKVNDGIIAVGLTENLGCIMMNQNDTKCPTLEQINLHGPRPVINSANNSVSIVTQFTIQIFISLVLIGLT